ncbi:hypothetical protein [Arthrobacter sp. NicSoilB8]|uniref:hypothetical protein n=1 Tax=Arthrobacter sp. NicSoilB8 TaxID=2830998 RepID=UPI001CC82BFA|nr:hypothetical protein [Arthrobacter sp. NicSoilB8]BCW73533.1 hypothetical protein NicSoilB8_45770 [Arthrobacter sp. NicSoilB8]
MAGRGEGNGLPTAEPFVRQDEVSNFTYYGYDPAARLISVRNSAGHSWEDGGTTPMPE